MNSFLSWIYAQASKVYQWFGNNFASLYSAAVNAWDWAVNFAESAYERAKSYAYSIYNEARNYTNSVKDYLKSLISNYISGIVQDINSVINWVEYKLSDISQIARSVINDAIEGVIASIINIRNEALNLFSNVASYVSDFVYSRFGWLLDVKDRIFALLEMVNLQNISMIFEFIGSWKNAIVSFFSNPTKFIFDLLEPKFVSLLCYVLAWGLGTTKYNLPNGKPWED